MAAEKDNLTPADHAATVRECLLRRGHGDYERAALDSLAALVALADRAIELEERLEWVKHLLPPSRSDELTEWLDRRAPLEDTEVAYVENLSAQEAVYWEARRRGMNLTDKQVGDLLRAAARAGFGGPADGAH